MSKTHLLCYIRRDGLTDWKVESLEQGAPSRPSPVFGSDDPTFARFATKGNVLWIVGAYPGAPLSLEARIVISKRLRKSAWKCAVSGGDNRSRFFGYNDASDAVMRLVFTNDENSPWSLGGQNGLSDWKQIYGQKLEGPRRLAPAGQRVGRLRSQGTALLERLARQATARSVFISYKHDDNKGSRRRFIRALTVELAKSGFSVWWDRMALTDVGVLRESPNKKDKLLNGLLQQGISGTTAVLALWTENYGCATGNAPNWTRDEWHVRAHVARIAMLSGPFVRKYGMSEPDRVIQIADDPAPDDAIDIARRFRRAYESIKRSRSASR